MSARRTLRVAPLLGLGALSVASASLVPAFRVAAADAVTGERRRPHDVKEWEEEWEWRRGDGEELWRGAQLCFVCGAVAAGFIAVGAVATHSQLRASKEADPSEVQAEAGVPDAPEAAGRNAGVAADAAVEACEPRPPSVLRALSLACIGLSPLLICVIIGESTESVLIAMLLMHWFGMLVLPAVYFAVSCCYGHGYPAYRFYVRLLGEQQANTEAKVLRGCALGVPLFAAVIVGYFSFRCKTLKWPLCISDFVPPLEEYGMEKHSMLFRMLAAAYFTFWNPAVEELFWRVFLHRELGEALGVNAEEERSLLHEGADDRPWRGLLDSALGALPGRAVTLRWGVSAMYAAYHTWPMKVILQGVWWIYGVVGFAFLLALGRFFLLLRELPQFGIVAAYIVHAWVDAGFALLCLFQLHPYDVVGEP